MKLPNILLYSIAALMIMLAIALPAGYLYAQETEGDTEATSEAEDDTSTETSDEDASPDETSENDPIDENVEELKERVEDKVNELQSQRNATGGFIQTVGEDTMEIDTLTQIVTVDIDPELTLYYEITSDGRQEIEPEDVDEGDYVLVAGPDIGGVITANEVYKDDHYMVKTGQIIEVNDDTFYITVRTQERDQYTIDIEQSTDQFIMDIETLELDTVGFSQLKVGDIVQFSALWDGDRDTTRFSATRTIIIPQEYFLQ